MRQFGWLCWKKYSEDICKTFWETSASYFTFVKYLYIWLTFSETYSQFSIGYFMLNLKNKLKTSF